MCGIAGIAQFGGSDPDDARRMRAMCRALAHRGPDDEGFYSDHVVHLGHRRLSILDLVGGRQPMPNEDGTLWITFNGEIFNFAELRRHLLARGHRFRTRSDTEVLVHLYEDQGTDCFARLNGQFALALWDRRRRELVLARDPFGILPLYYARRGERWLFASEVKGLLASGLIDAHIDLRALAQIATFGAAVAPRTLFDGVRSLEPGCSMRVTARGACIERYWDLPFVEATDETRRATQPTERHRRDAGATRAAGYAALVREELQQAVRRRMVADVPVGLYLSGGIDSAAVAACMAAERRESSQAPGARSAALNSRLSTLDSPAAFHVAFHDASLDESHAAASVADHLGLEQHAVRFSDATLYETLLPLIASCESALFSLEAAAVWQLSRLTTRHRKVVLSGQGADELFGGYPYVAVALFREALNRPPWSLARPPVALAERLLTGGARLLPGRAELARAARHFGEYPAVQTMFSALEVLQGLFSADVRRDLAGYNAYEELPRLPDHARRWHCFDRWMYVGYKTFLANYLLSIQGDRTAMAHSVEVRFPFLDPQLVASLARIPPAWRHRRGREKYVLREAFRGLVPETVRKRRKQALMASWGTALVSDRAPDFVRHMLDERTVRGNGLFHPAAVRQWTARLRELSDHRRSVAGLHSLMLDRRFQQRCLCGMGVNLVVTAHLWSEVFRSSAWRPAAARRPVSAKAPEAVAPAA